MEENKFISLNEVEGKVMITIHKPGYPLKEFEKVLHRNPRIKILNFIELTKALNSEELTDFEVGLFLPSIELEYTNDLMSAHIIVHETIEYYDEYETNLNKRVNLLLRENGIVHGIQDIILKEVKTSKPYTIAKGTPPQKGSDAKIKYLERPERKPIIDEEGKADYFDMNFILEINKDDWLGEKLEAQEGVSGTNIKGDSIPAVNGKDLNLKYDSKSVYEIDELGKSVLRAQMNGVLDIQDGKIMVRKHLPINGDVGVETGNLKFDGSISITGTVISGFSVIASGDISIESSDGVFHAKHIESVHGDIYIRGGIFGKGKSLVEAGGSIFVKHSNESILSANKDIHIGYYALGSTIRANNVFVNELKGKIIGGRTEALNVITTAYSGNRLERKTDLIVHGINRQALQNEVKIKAVELREIQEEIYSCEKKVTQLQLLLGKMSLQQVGVYEESKLLLEDKQKHSSQLDMEIQQILVLLRTPDECEIRVTKEANAGTHMQVGSKTKSLKHVTSGVFKIENGVLNV